MNHRQKLKLARKMMTPNEIKEHTPPFDSYAWNKRKKQIRDRVKLREYKKQITGR